MKRLISAGTRHETVLHGRNRISPCRTDDILASFQSTYLSQREPIFRNCLLAHIHRRSLLPENEAESVNPVPEREGKDLHHLILIDQLRLLHLQRHEIYLELYSLPEIGHEEFQDRAQGPRSINRKVGTAAQHTHRREKAK